MIVPASAVIIPWSYANYTADESYVKRAKPRMARQMRWIREILNRLKTKITAYQA